VFHGRKKLVATLSGLALAGTIGFIPALPAAAGPQTTPLADPNIKDVQAKVDSLYHQAEQASEQLNTTKIQLRSMRQELGSLQSDQDRQDAKVQSAQTNLQNSIISQYEGQDLSAVGAVTDSDDPNAFVDKISTMSSYNDMQAQLFSDYATQAKALDLRQQATAARTADLAKAEAQIASDKATIEKNLAAAKAVLGNLQAKQREELLSRSSTRVPAGVNASGRAAIALHYAMAQVGKAYVYGAAGPNAFDCSGLMMAAWGAAGVGLPHSSSAQYNSGTHVSASELQPGDLVFYYSPISHVGMYIGNGLVVAAQNPSDGVRVVGLYSMPYSGAVHIG
jgi:cell wall-associated NlpC family hydrolase